MRELKFLQKNGFYEEPCPYNIKVETVGKYYIRNSIRTINSLNCFNCMHNQGVIQGRKKKISETISVGYILCDRDEGDIKYSRLTFKLLLIEKKNTKM